MQNLAHTAENGVWRHVNGEWRQLFGSFARQGISLEYHHFRADRELDWSRSFHADSLELCLNLQGTGRLCVDAHETLLGVRSVAWYATGDGRQVAATRDPGEHHHFLTVELSREALGRRVGAAAGSLLPAVGRFVDGAEPVGAFVSAGPMSLAVQGIARSLAEPLTGVASPARALWYEAKVLELLALLLFSPAPVQTEELFCDRQKRLGRERIERACAILARDLENPPTLEMLAREVGCGAFHLSRTFSQQVGQTVPQYLRQLRLERAAKLLREGRHNVTEAAMAVGYSSLSHFSKAFWEAFGCCPGLYSDAKLRAVTQKSSGRR